MNDGTTDGMQLVRYESHRIRQKEPTLLGELGAGAYRNCEQPQDVAEQVEDPETQEMVDTYQTTPEKYQKWSESGPVAMTEEERAQRDAYDIAQAVAKESAKQASKSLKLKQAENNFFILCTSMGLEGKPTFNEMNAGITSIQETDPDAAVVLSLKLLAVDAEAKREGGLEWWDTAAWHSDIIE